MTDRHTLESERILAEQFPALRDPDDAYRRTTEQRVPLGRVFAAVVALETLYFVLRSIAWFADFHPDYTLWPVGLIAAVLWPLTFGWAAFVLWRPKLPESGREALLRLIPVWLVAFVNLMLVLALIDRPEWVLRWPV